MLPEDKRYGAIEPYAYGLCKELSRKSLVSVYSYGFGFEKKKTLTIETYHYKPKILHSMQPLLSGYFGINQSLQNGYFFKNMLKTHRNRKINVFHLHNSSSAPVLPLCKAITSAPAVCSVHSYYRPIPLLRRFDKLLPVSEYMKQYLHLQKGISLKKIDVLNIAIDPNDWKVRIGKEKAKKFLNCEKNRIILFVGRKCPEKGPLVLLNALKFVVAEYPNALAILIGPDYWHDSPNTSYTKFLTAESQRLGIEKNVLFKMRLDEAVLKQFYEAADVFVMPSVWQEPFGKVIIEAMANEKAVVATRVGGVPEIVTHRKDGLLVKPNDSYALADAILELLRDTDFALSLGAKAKQTVEEKFSFPVVAKRCLEIYQTLRY